MFIPLLLCACADARAPCSGTSDCPAQQVCVVNDEGAFCRERPFYVDVVRRGAPPLKQIDAPRTRRVRAMSMPTSAQSSSSERFTLRPLFQQRRSP